MAALAQWHGTPDERLALAQIIGGNCTCDFDGLGQVRTRCASHRMLTDDQKALDGLLFWRHASSLLEGEEFSPCPHPHVLRAPTPALPDEPTEPAA